MQSPGGSSEVEPFQIILALGTPHKQLFGKLDLSKAVSLHFSLLVGGEQEVHVGCCKLGTSPALHSLQFLLGHLSICLNSLFPFVQPTSRPEDRGGCLLPYGRAS